MGPGAPPSDQTAMRPELVHSQGEKTGQQRPVTCKRGLREKWHLALLQA